MTPADKTDSRHPFSADIIKEEFDIIKKNYPGEIEDILYVNSADICAWGELLKKNGYKAACWITGTDEYNVYKKMSAKVPEYEEHNKKGYDCKDAYTKSFYVEEVQRDDEAISATKVRQALKDDNKELYISYMPKGTDVLYNKFREIIIKESKYNKTQVKRGMKSLTQFIKESLVQENYSEKEFKALYKAIEDKDATKLIDFVEKSYRRRQDGDIYDSIEKLNQDEYCTICAIDKTGKEVVIATKEYEDWLVAYVWGKDKIQYTQTSKLEMIDKNWKSWYLNEYDDKLEWSIMKNVDNYIE